MAHKQIGNVVVVDWTTGDPEGDRINVLSAYRDFIKDIKLKMQTWDNKDFGDLYQDDINEIFEKWSVDTENQIDEVPRIWIKRP